MRNAEDRDVEFGTRRGAIGHDKTKCYRRADTVPIGAGTDATDRCAVGQEHRLATIGIGLRFADLHHHQFLHNSELLLM